MNFGSSLGLQSLMGQSQRALLGMQAGWIRAGTMVGLDLDPSL